MFKNYLVKIKKSIRKLNYMPLTGEYVKIEDIPDPVFAQK